jgi:hypothetical protein
MPSLMVVLVENCSPASRTILFLVFVQMCTFELGGFSLVHL